MVRIGDIIEIPLSNDRKAYGQYVFKDRTMGPMLQVFDLIVKDRINIEVLEGVGKLFPPVITGLYAAVRQGLWTVTGRTSVKGFRYPNFIKTLYDDKTGKASIWYIWDGNKSIRIGPELPPEYKNLEYLVVWSLQDIVKRIETGIYPYPYGDLIKNNEFTPHKFTQHFKLHY